MAFTLHQNENAGEYGYVNRRLLMLTIEIYLCIVILV